VEIDFRNSLAITAPDLENDVGCRGCSETVQVFDFADAGIAWHSRRLRLALTENASGGLFNSSNLLQPLPTAPTAPGTTMPPTAPMPVQLAPAPSTITTGSTRTAATMGYQLDRLSGLGADVAYLVAGGLDDASRAYLPLQQTARADAFFDQAVSRRDHLSTRGYAQDTQFSSGPCLALVGATATTATTGVVQCAPHDVLVQVAESWRHQISRAMSLTMSAGVTDVRVTGAGPQTSVWCDGSSDCFFPNADVAFSSLLGFRGSTQLLVDASLVPLVDLRTGLVSDRLQVVASLSGRLTRRVALYVDLSGSQTVPPSDPLAASIVTGGVGADFRLTRRLTLSCTERALWEEQSGFGRFFTSLTSVNVTVTSPMLRL
jgi:hypothetical protein